jgi:hypothetical protein
MLARAACFTEVADLLADESAATINCDRIAFVDSQRRFDGCDTHQGAALRAPREGNGRVKTILSFGH